MAKKPAKQGDLRKRAEKMVLAPDTVKTLSTDEVQQAIHELQVHQIELEMQNEELRRAQVELEASRERYIDLYDLAPVGYFTLNEKRIILGANLRAAKLLGVARAALTKQSFSRFVLPEDQDIYYRHSRELFEKGGPAKCELRLVRSDGAQSWVRLEATLAEDGDGNPVYRAAMSDITERKEMEETLRESEEKYRSVFAAEGDALFLADQRTGAILDVNDAACRLYGYTREELLKLRNIDMSAEPEETARATREFRNTIGDRLHKKKDETVFPVDISASLFILKGREVILAAARDITERKRTERRRYLSGAIMHILNDSPTLADALNSVLPAIKQEGGFDALGIRLRSGDDYPYFVQNGFSNGFLFAENTLIRNAPEGGLCRDENGNYSLECTCGLVISGKFDPASSPFSPGGSFWTNDTTPLLDLPAAGDPRVNPRNRCIHEGFLSVALIPIRAQQKIVGLLQLNSRKRDRFTPDMVHFFEDICASIGTAVMRNQAEDELKMAHEQLEKQVQERTADLTEALDKLKLETAKREEMEGMLRQAEKMEAIGTMAGGIAHDFNNILAAVLGFTEMAIDDNTPPKLSLDHHLQLVLKAALRGRDLVKQILAFSRKQFQEVVPLQLAALVNETVKLLRASLPAIIHIKVKIESASDTVLADTSQMQQVVMNLCINAGFAMRDKGGKLMITVSDADESSLPSGLNPRPYILLSVKDTGSGMTPEVIKRVFEPFFTTKDPGQGTGMGLAVTYGIVKSLNGEITVESKPGKGAAFNVFIPKAEPSVQPHETTQGQIPRGTERILFVDDEETLVVWGEETLQRLGYKVFGFKDSRDALSSFLVDPYSFDIVITDYTMPTTTGFFLAKKLLTVRPDIPIILLTGYNEDVSPEKAKKAGIVEILMKPVSKRELAEAVRRVFDGEDAQRVYTGG